MREQSNVVNENTSIPFFSARLFFLLFFPCSSRHFYVLSVSSFCSSLQCIFFFFLSLLFHLFYCVPCSIDQAALVAVPGAVQVVRDAIRQRQSNDPWRVKNAREQLDDVIVRSEAMGAKECDVKNTQCDACSCVCVCVYVCVFGGCFGDVGACSPILTRLAQQSESCVPQDWRML
jgi:hypothetical protein